MARRRSTSKLKAQVVVEVLAGDQTPAQITRAYGMRPDSVGPGKRRLHREGIPRSSPRRRPVNAEHRIGVDLGTAAERRKEAEIALPEDCLGRND